MTAAESTTQASDLQADKVSAGRAMRATVFVGTIFVIIALAILPLLTPFFIHPVLDAAGGAERLGVTAEQAHLISDRSVEELIAGPGTFAFEGPDGSPFYDSSEQSHLRDARTLLWIFLAAGALSALIIGIGLVRAKGAARASLWRSISRAGAAAAVTVVVLGVVSLLAFDALFTLFHQVFFPGGNWAFDASTQRMVQLYPFRFWQMAAAALGTLVLILAVLTAGLGRAMAGRPRPPTPTR